MHEVRTSQLFARRYVSSTPSSVVTKAFTGKPAKRVLEMLRVYAVAMENVAVPAHEAEKDRANVIRDILANGVPSAQICSSSKSKRGHLLDFHAKNATMLAPRVAPVLVEARAKNVMLVSKWAL